MANRDGLSGQSWSHASTQPQAWPILGKTLGKAATHTLEPDVVQAHPRLLSCGTVTGPRSGKADAASAEAERRRQ